MSWQKTFFFAMAWQKDKLFAMAWQKIVFMGVVTYVLVLLVFCNALGTFFRFSVSIATWADPKLPQSGPVCSPFVAGGVHKNVVLPSRIVPIFLIITSGDYIAFPI